MVAHRNIPGSSHHAWVHGTKKDCEKWLARQYDLHGSSVTSGSGLLSDREAARVRYLDGSRVYDWRDNPANDATEEPWEDRFNREMAAEHS